MNIFKNMSALLKLVLWLGLDLTKWHSILMMWLIIIPIKVFTSVKKTKTCDKKNTFFRIKTVRRISIPELKELEPGLDCEGVSSAILSEEEYIVDPWLLSKIS